MMGARVGVGTGAGTGAGTGFDGGRRRAAGFRGEGVRSEG